ncbi:Outer membrane efflux protein [Bythopirellula polymerisocia]|uniref:Outer membrane efflux protein n=1 Tax=Bythopirellula polymerisocia TaxID=2528003 RepID=A0A5C6CEN9_9BACT|nr:Outer membrane efflux protein [Bythopirellula polymerisocia]
MLALGCATDSHVTPARDAHLKTSSVANYSSPAEEVVENKLGDLPLGENSIEDVENLEPATSNALQASTQSSDQSSSIKLLSAIEELPPIPGQETEVGNDSLLSDGSMQVDLEMVIQAVYLHFPLIRAAQASRGIAAGDTQSARGAFDHKLASGSENQALGFYENYRQELYVKRDTYWGGEVFGGYRIGRGNFEPWYLERQTNAGGEFKSGVVVPLAQNRWIDANRAELWRAQLERRRVEPAIQAEIIASILDAKVAYWMWIAAAENRTVVDNLLDFALERNSALKRQVETGDRAEIELVDNQRLIVSRESKLIEANRKLQQSSIKLALYLRSADGAPLIPDEDWMPGGFPDTISLIDHSVDEDIVVAQQNRPETRELDLQRRQLNVDLQQAENLCLPEVNGALIASQDVGQATSFKKDKSEFELTAAMFVDVPLERNKALGKIRATRSKIAQVTAKRQYTADKISTEVRYTRTALRAAYERVGKIKESADLAVRMELAEQKAFELGASTLLNVNLREQQAADAAAELVAARFDYFVALAEYQASLGFSDSLVSENKDQEAAEEIEIPALPNMN